MTELQAEVASSADDASAHATAPALLIAAQAALGLLAASTDTATDSGRLPFRIESGWQDQLGQLAYLAYLLADQTGVDLDAAVLRACDRTRRDSTRRAETLEQGKHSGWL